ncbi:MAG: DUF5330 domain-containing protein [Hyphomicrobiales bacterium]
MIMFLIRTVFWVSLIVLILPIDKSKTDATVTQVVSTAGAIEIASGAISDLASFCGRNPETCEKGRDFANAFGVKAVYASGLLYKFLDEQFAEKSVEAAAVSKNQTS